MSEESVFASYNNQLLKDFNIFALNKSDILNNKLCSYINENISSYSSDISLSDCAQGIMQLMPTTAESLGVEDPFDARQNITGGAPDRQLQELKWHTQSLWMELTRQLFAEVSFV